MNLTACGMLYLARLAGRSVGSRWLTSVTFVAAALVSHSASAAASADPKYPLGSESPKRAAREDARLPKRVGQRLETRINTRIAPRAAADFQPIYEVQATSTNQARTMTPTMAPASD